MLAGGAALGLAACGGPARGRDPLKSIQQGLAAAPLPPPWEPLVVSGTAVEVAGHRYRFDAGPFPTSLEVNGAEFLFDAVKLDVRVQDELLAWQRARTVSLSATDVELLARGNAGDLIAQTRVSISYDGMCRFRVSLIPQGVITIDSILLDVPILREETTHYTHHLLGADAVANSWEEVAGDPEAHWGGGRIPDNGWSGEITPHFWVGNPERGIVWFTDVIVGPQRQQGATQVQLRPVAGAMRLLVELITDPLDMPGTIHLDFGLQPTPVRPGVTPRRIVKPVEGNWSAELERLAESSGRTASDTRKSLESLRDRGATAIVLKVGWSDVWGFPYLESAESKRRFHDLANLTHDAGLKLIPTLSAYGLSNRAPGAAELLEDTPLKGDLILVGREPPEGFFPLFHTADTAEFVEQGVRTFAEEFPIDGVYAHFTEPAVRPVDRNFALPGASATLDLHARRDLLRRLYALFHGGLRERDDEGIVIANTPIPWSMMHGYADLLIAGGYQYQTIASRRLSGEGLAERWPPEILPYLYGDVLHRVPTLWHAPAEDIAFNGPVESYIRAELTSDQELFGLAALHDTWLWPSWSQTPDGLAPTPAFEELARLERLRQRLGFVGAHPTEVGAAWNPYWQRQQRLIVQPPSTFYSHWQKDSGEMLLLLLNGANNEQDILVEVADGGSRLAAEDVWNGAPVRTRENLIITTLGPSQFAALHVRQG